jgi:hypothetical protein
MHVIGFDTVGSLLRLHKLQQPPGTNPVLLLQSSRARKAARTGYVLFAPQVATPNGCSRPCSYVTVAWGKLCEISIWKLRTLG